MAIVENESQSRLCIVLKAYRGQRAWLNDNLPLEDPNYLDRNNQDTRGNFFFRNKLPAEIFDTTPLSETSFISNVKKVDVIAKVIT